MARAGEVSGQDSGVEGEGCPLSNLCCGDVGRAPTLEMLALLHKLQTEEVITGDFQVLGCTWFPLSSCGT